MKVQNINTIESGLINRPGLDNREAVQDNNVLFRKTLTSLTDDAHVQKLRTMMENIDEQADKLVKRADIGEFTKYRRMIRDFLDDIVSNGYEFSKENKYGARGRNRFFATVKTIDEKLDEMAKEVLEEQSDSIKLLDSIDDIRGLLLDILF